MPRFVSIVSPCYREQANIASLVQAVDDACAAQDWDYELILVNDGSPDATWSEIQAAAARDGRVVGIDLSRNFGKESAMYAGLQAARGDAVVIMDADLQHPPALLPEMIARMDADGADQVIARRTRDGEGWLRKRMSQLYYRLVQRLVEVELGDGVGDFRALSRRAVDAILQMSESNRFSKGLFAWIGFRQVTIDYTNVGRDAGESSWSFWSLLDYGLDGVIAFSRKPLQVAFHVGVLSVLAGLLYLAWMFVQWLTGGGATAGYYTTIAAVIVLGGVQMMLLGITGEYIGRIHQEVKHRPIYLVADVVGRTEARPGVEGVPYQGPRPETSEGFRGLD
ncbi:glycosyltransferase family 2 protein [Micrococcus sp.]|uniref:glycosyltransferase family 2 protein n=1 Tax=Micrococcus sp. TaxID=1271 RepID=UPI002A90CDEE|nr:glycosyltransferase family 2 protein [Micrococcus sp.]MDY6054450.1 glycosyltransferase family 2 protein [Micrococcus sp.]